MPVFELFKKLKRLRHFKLSAGVLGFFLASISVIFCFFYLDYRAVLTWFPFPAQSDRFLSKGSSEDQRVEFLGQKGNGCDIFEGDWVWDENYPLYQSKDCRFLDDGFRCSENGRPDLRYTKWRWQPKDCNLPRFLLKSYFGFVFCLKESTDDHGISISLQLNIINLNIYII